MKRLENKVAIVTGAGRGIGEAVARLFVAEGASVVITDVLAENGEKVASDLGAKACFVQHDVSNEEQWQSVADRALSEYGQVDILVNNAGVGGVHFETLENISMDVVRSMIDVNLIGTILGVKTVTPIMRGQGGGGIINISSANGLVSANALSVYSATKWAVRGLTKAAALELGPKGIRVNSIHPGGADTLMGNVNNLPREDFDKRMRMTPLQRACDPKEVADGVLFFASNESAYCTGSELAIDGGLTAGIYHKGLPGHYSEA